MPTLWHANACARFVLCYSKHLARFQNECIATKTPLECFQHVLLNGLYWFLCDCHGYTIYILSVTCGILYSKGCFNSFSTADKTKRWKYHLEWKKNFYTIWTFLNSNLFMVSIQLGEVWNPHENSWEKLLTSNAKRESKIHILLAYWMFGAVKNEHVI